MMFEDKEETDMKDIIAFLNQNKFGSLATIASNKPDVRPFEFVCYDDDGMFFYTDRESDVFSQLNENPTICFCATDSDYNYVKVSGSVSFCNDRKEKEKVLTFSAFAKDNFDPTTLAGMEVFHLSHGCCKQHFHSSNKTKTCEF